MTETIGSKLTSLRERAGMSLKEVAKAAGFRGPSSVQAYFNPDYDIRPLRGSVALRLGEALMGRGDPPIRLEEVFELANIGLEDLERAVRFNDRGPRLPTVVQSGRVILGPKGDIPVYGSALAADLDFGTDGGKPHPIEITTFGMSEIITHVRRPPGLGDRSGVYAVFVSGSSMEPRYRAGEPVFVDSWRPPANGDDVIVQLTAGAGSEEVVTGLIKTLVRRTSQFLELRQYQPEILFRIPAERVANIHRVIPWREVVGL